VSTTQLYHWQRSNPTTIESFCVMEAAAAQLRVTIMDDVDYPTVASTVPVFDWDSILYLPTYDQMLASHLADEAEMAANEASCKLKREIKETPTEIWKRTSNQNQAKMAKSVKATAKKWVKQKKVYKLTSHFCKK
jgi:hypothetical protein